MLKKPSIQTELKAIAAALKTHSELLAEQVSLEKQQADLVKQIDFAVRDGDVNDQKLAQQLATDRARMDMFPTKLAQLESAINEAHLALKPLLSEVSRILGQHSADVQKAAREELDALLASHIDDIGIRIQMLDIGVASVKNVRRADIHRCWFGPQAINEHQSEQNLPKLATELLTEFGDLNPA
jgi:hypothetical protein